MPRTTTKLRWGILGVARNNRRVPPAFAQAANAKLHAIASRSTERARSAAVASGIPTAYDGYERLLDDPAIDAVYIPLPNGMHAEWTMKAVERDKHVLCEKPLAPTAAEARKVVEFCRAKGVCLLDGFAWPHHPRTALRRARLSAHIRRDGIHFRSSAQPEQHSPGRSAGAAAGCRLLSRLRDPVPAWTGSRHLHITRASMPSGTLWRRRRRKAFDCGSRSTAGGWRLPGPTEWSRFPTCGSLQAVRRSPSSPGKVLRK